jgi:hypothetical protein
MEMISARLLERQQIDLENGLGTASREDVSIHFCIRASGVSTKTADQRTKAFYRSSGNAWARALG